MSPGEYAATINRSTRCVQNWCAQGLLGRRVGAHFEIDPDAVPPVIVPKRKTGRVKMAVRLENFKRKKVTADPQSP